MAAKVIFVNKNDKSQSFNVNLFGPEKNRVKLATVLAVIKSSVAMMDDGTVMEADEDGLSMDTFVAGRTYTLALMPQGFDTLTFMLRQDDPMKKMIKDVVSLSIFPELRSWVHFWKLIHFNLAFPYHRSFSNVCLWLKLIRKVCL